MDTRTSAFRAGTIGALLREGITTAQIGGLRLVDEEGDERYCCIELQIRPSTAERSCRANHLPVDLPAFALDVDPNARTRADQAVTRWLATVEPRNETELLAQVLDSLIPPLEAGSLFAWAIEHGLALLNGDRGAIARLETNERTMILRAKELTYERSFYRFGGGQALVSLEIAERGAEPRTKEQRVPADSLRFTADRLPAPNIDRPPLSDWIAAWRTYMDRRLTRYDVSALPMDMYPQRSVVQLVQFWLENGPAPAPEPPRLALDEERTSRVSTELRAGNLKKKSFPNIRCPAPVQAAFRLGDYVIALCPALKEEQLYANAVFLLAKDSAPILLLRSTGCLDGDAVVMREVLAWLADAMVRAGVDKTFRRRLDDNFPESVKLSDWIRFRASDYDFEEPIYDPRLVEDSLVDEPYWKPKATDTEAHVAEQQRIRDEDIPRYYAFIRAFIDPSFRGRFEKLSE